MVVTSSSLSSAFPVPVLKGRKLLVIESRFYVSIADALLAGVQAVLRQAQVEIQVASVPGALDIPIAASIFLRQDSFDGIIALGCVIRGETTHYDIVANESARALTTLMTTHAMPFGNGILTVETEEQALYRAITLDKGGAAALAALTLSALQKPH
jgi:6,7-dimethyl-8-ribityllumazine synthase